MAPSQHLPSQPPKDGFPERLRQLRKQRGLSQTEFGELVRLHYTPIGRYERGASKLSADELRRLADGLGVSTDYLMEGTTEEAAKVRFEDREFLRQFQEIEDLPDDDKLVVKKLLDAFLTKKQIQLLAG